MHSRIEFARILPHFAWISFVIWVMACLVYPLTDSDIWWHLAAGRWIWEQQSFLRTDPFTQVSLGQRWIDLHWGFQLLVHGLYSLGGLFTLLAAKCLALLAGLGFICMPHWNRKTVHLLLPLAAFGIYHTRYYLDMRPLVFTLLFLSAQYAILIAHLQGKWKSPWVLILPLQILLVNIQGLFPLGAFLVTVLLLGERNYRELGPAIKRERMITVVGSWLGCLVNPYGWEGLKLAATLLERIKPVASNVFSSGIAENEPFFVLVRRHPDQALPMLVFIGIVFATFARKNWRVHLNSLVIFSVFLVLGLMAVRNQPLMVWAGIMAAGRNLNVSSHLASPVKVAFWNRMGLAALLGIYILYGPSLKKAWEYEIPGALITPFRFPTHAIEYLEQNPIPGPIFNELRYGGYLTFRLYPKTLAFIDGRMVLRSEAFYQNFLDIIDHPEKFPAYARSYGITHALLPISEDGRYRPLAAFLLGHQHWTLLFCDGASILLLNKLDGPVDNSLTRLAINQAIETRFGGNRKLEAIAKRNVADFLEAAGLRYP